MRPRTRLQYEVLDLSRHHLHDMTYNMTEWAKQDVLAHKGFATKKQIYCMDCGLYFSPDLVKRKKAICPHCHTKLIAEQTKKRTDKQRVYFALAEICGDFQVVRYYEMLSYHKIGQSRQVSCCEVLQHWVHQDGKREVVAKNHTVSRFFDSWNGDLEIRDKKASVWRDSPDLKYDIYTEHFHPDSVFKPMYRKYGINRHLAGLTFIEAIDIVPKEPKAETLLKAKQHRILSHINQNRRRHIYHFWNSIKICIRNNYKPFDAGMWLDYLGLLDDFGKDLRNAHYVCPKDLKAEHDRYVEKKRRKREREDKERALKRALQQESRYKEFIQRFVDLEFESKDIHISPLKTVAEFEVEGKELKHCVFESNYFERANVLILSAKVNGVRTETIELNLQTMRVEQCRGLNNQNTEHHERILRLMNRSKKFIQERLTA